MELPIQDNLLSATAGNHCEQIFTSFEILLFPTSFSENIISKS